MTLIELQEARDKLLSIYYNGARTVQGESGRVDYVDGAELKNRIAELNEQIAVLDPSQSRAGTRTKYVVPIYNKGVFSGPFFYRR